MTDTTDYPQLDEPTRWPVDPEPVPPERDMLPLAAVALVVALALAGGVIVVMLGALVGSGIDALAHLGRVWP